MTIQNTQFLKIKDNAVYSNIIEYNNDGGKKIHLIPMIHFGEDQYFKELIQFVKDTNFDKLGVFKYSHEEDTYSFKEFEDNISDKIKQKRFNEVMQLQQEISLKLNNQKVGKIYKVIIDRREGEFFIGRTQCDSPEIDGEILIKAQKIKIGEFYDIVITEAETYDLYGIKKE